MVLEFAEQERRCLECWEELNRIGEEASEQPEVSINSSSVARAFAGRILTFETTRLPLAHTPEFVQTEVQSYSQSHAHRHQSRM